MMESQASQSDADLLALVGTGDVAAFKSLVTRYHGPFMAMALSNSLSHADCEEAVGGIFNRRTKHGRVFVVSYYY